MNTSASMNIDSGNFLSQHTSLGANTGGTFFCAHSGRSMNPTLSARDLLEIRPYVRKKPEAGDVILFQPPGQDHFVVHRIVLINKNSFRTRGDNNSFVTDTETLKQEDIFGRVIAAHRGSSRRKIAGGIMGRAVHRYCQIRRLASMSVVTILGPVYRSLCSDGFLHWLIPVRIKPQIALFKMNHSNSHKLLLGQSVIGSYDENLLKWQIRRPYRLFIDESSLPPPR